MLPYKRYIGQTTHSTTFRRKPPLAQRRGSTLRTLFNHRQEQRDRYITVVRELHCPFSGIRHSMQTLAFHIIRHLDFLSRHQYSIFGYDLQVQNEMSVHNDHPSSLCDEVCGRTNRVCLHCMIGWVSPFRCEVWWMGAPFQLIDFSPG